MTKKGKGKKLEPPRAPWAKPVQARLAFQGLAWPLCRLQRALLGCLAGITS